jgi:N-acetyl-alpha-D-muramate 1-phosphate uridylyltransferase
MLSAMILAAGRGERLRPLTDHTPKPLISVAGKSLIIRHLERLESTGGIDQVVINHAWLGSLLEERVRLLWKEHSLAIEFSAEHQRGLETGGGILKALPLLSDPFIVINGDIFTEFDFTQLITWANRLDRRVLGKLVLVPNPDHHPQGDFSLSNGFVSLDQSQPMYTYSGISILRHALFNGYPHNQRLALGKEVLKSAIENKCIEGVLSEAFWMDVGTVDRLAVLRERYKDGTPINQA